MSVISNQATINVGTLGHVSHGKSTLIKALTGVNTIRHYNELERNITIKLGYANAKIYRCDKCERPKAYWSQNSKGLDQIPCQQIDCPGTLQIIRHISFVDVPGHQNLMATMLSGVSIMDAGILLVASNENFPQPQTQEHLIAVEAMKLKNICVLQNKVDLIGIIKAKEQFQKMKDFFKDTIAKDAPIIPISAQLGLNLDVLCEYLANLPEPKRDLTSPAFMMIVRSFNVNKPGIQPEELVGGIAGGSLLKGQLKIGDEIEIRPGIVKKDLHTGKTIYQPLYTKVLSLLAETNQLEIAYPGGLIGVGTSLDPSVCRADHLVGQILGHRGSLPKVYLQLEFNYILLKKMFGLSNEEIQRLKSNQSKSNDNTKLKVSPIQENEYLMLNIGAISVSSKVLKINSNIIRVQLSRPICTNLHEKVSISRKSIQSGNRLIGWGEIIAGKAIDQYENTSQ